MHACATSVGLLFPGGLPRRLNSTPLIIKFNLVARQLIMNTSMHLAIKYHVLYPQIHTHCISVIMQKPALKTDTAHTPVRGRNAQFVIISYCSPLEFN